LRITVQCHKLITLDVKLAGLFSLFIFKSAWSMLIDDHVQFRMALHFDFDFRMALHFDFDFLMALHFELVVCLANFLFIFKFSYIFFVLIFLFILFYIGVVVGLIFFKLAIPM
jgi:hypothetical protein